MHFEGAAKGSKHKRRARSRPCVVVGRRNRERRHRADICMNAAALLFLFCDDTVSIPVDLLVILVLSFVRTG